MLSKYLPRLQGPIYYPSRISLFRCQYFSDAECAGVDESDVSSEDFVGY